MNELEPYAPSFLLESAELAGTAGIFMLDEDLDKLAATPTLSNIPGLFEDGRANLNLVLSDVNYSIASHARLQPHIGDSFSHYFFGDAPVVMQASAKVLQTHTGYSKHVLTTLYERVLRLHQVTRLGVSPYLEFKGTSAFGAMLSMALQETADTPDILAMTFEWLVCKVFILNDMNSSGITDVEWSAISF